MDYQPKTFWESVFAGVSRFIVSAFFGGFISLIILIVMLFLMVLLKWHDYQPGYAWHFLWIIPVCCGMIGIFRFDAMLEMVQAFYEKYFHL
jgi:cell division protein FtsX